MENVIYYFSGTGNSLKVSKDLANELKNTKIIPIKKAINSEINKSVEKVGFIFPVYFGALPPLVAEFISKLDTSQMNYIYVVATHNDFPGGALNVVAKLTKKGGKKLNAGFTIQMPGNYIPLYAPLTREKQVQRFNVASKKIKEIVKIIRESKETKLSRFGGILTFLQKRHNRKFPIKDKNFWVEDTCNSCEICYKICPVQNIEMIEGKPSWTHHCQQCFSCLHWCPEEAIQYGKKTIGRARYHHPDITFNEILG